MNKRQYTLWRHDFVTAYPNLSLSDLEQALDNKNLFSNIEEIDGCNEVLLYYENEINPKILQIGSDKNLDNKFNFFIDTRLPIYEVMELPIEKWKSQIKKVTNKKSIIVSNRVDVLENSKSGLKILFTNNMPFDEQIANKSIYTANTWQDIGEILNFYIKNRELI